jgi:hypothetical protein
MEYNIIDKIEKSNEDQTWRWKKHFDAIDEAKSAAGKFESSLSASIVGSELQTSAQC